MHVDTTPHPNMKNHEAQALVTEHGADRFCGAVHLPEAPIEFPGLVLSILDADLAKIQQCMSTEAAARLWAPDTDRSSLCSHHVCHECAPSRLEQTAAQAITGPATSSLPLIPEASILNAQGGATAAPSQEGGLRNASLTSHTLLQGHTGCASARCIQDDGGKKLIEALTEAPKPMVHPSEVATTGGSPQTYDKQRPSRSHAIGPASADNTLVQCETFVSDPDGSKVFDIMSWYISGRSFVHPPRLPRCLPYSSTASVRKPTPAGASLRATQSVQGGGRFPDRSARRHASKPRNRTAMQIYALPDEEAQGVHAIGDVRHKVDHAVTVASQPETMHAKGKPGKSRKRGSARGKGSAGRACGSQASGAVQEGAIQKQVGKRRGGRLERELAETDAAGRDGMVELGFNAHLKQFEKSQREKGIFKNRQKARPSVYTVSGVPQQD